MVVLPDADLDLAADAAVNAGFGSAGERCMAISVVVAVEPVGDELVEQDRRADGRAAHRRRPARAATWARWSPRRTADKVASYVDAGVAAGAELVVDGRDVTPDGDAGRLLARPDAVRPRRRRRCRSTPTRSSARCSPWSGSARYDEALELVNANPYGNGTAIFTNDGGAARRFQNEVEVGMVGVNVPIPVPMAYYSFGGWKASLFGDTARARRGRRALLHPRQGGHQPLARPAPRRRQPRLPHPDLSSRSTPAPARYATSAGTGMPSGSGARGGVALLISSAATTAA